MLKGIIRFHAVTLMHFASVPFPIGHELNEVNGPLMTNFTTKSSTLPLKGCEKHGGQSNSPLHISDTNHTIGHP